MSIRQTLILMLQHLQNDMSTVHHAGAGYYSCVPYIRRYNKLLAQARTLFPSNDGIISTFDNLDEEDPKDPSEKSKVIQAIGVESGQLITLLESTKENADEENQ